MNARAGSNLILVVYFIKNLDRISRDVAFGDVMLEGVTKLAGQREMEEYYIEGSVSTPTVHTKDW